MQKVKHVPPFCDESSAPPAFSSLLTDQPELFGSNTHHSPNLLTVQIIPPQSKSVVQIRIALTEQPALPKMGASLPSKQCRHAARSPYPTTKQERQHCQARARSHGRADSESPSEDSSSSLDSTLDSESTLSEEPPKIPKPAGEPGRPGRGGYNLKCALDWDNNVYTKFKVRLFDTIATRHDYISYSTAFHAQAHRRASRYDKMFLCPGHSPSEGCP